MTTIIPPVLPTGIYYLENEVANPDRDRRVKYDWKKQDFPAGQYEVTNQEIKFDDTVANLTHVRPLDPKTRGTNLHLTKEHFLVPLLKPMDGDSLDLVCRDCPNIENFGIHIYQALLDAGKITLDDLREAYEKIPE
jgi:hypothetical protein